MKKSLMVVAAASALALPGPAVAQTPREGVARASADFARLVETLGGLSARDRAALPLDVRRLLDLAERWQSGAIPRPSMRTEAPQAEVAFALATTAPLPAGRVSDPRRDLLYSSVAGAHQAGSSTAWCSPNVVTVFDDTEGLIRFLLGAAYARSDAAYSYSINNGTSFFYGGGLEPLLAGRSTVATDATAACTDKNTFFIAGSDGSGIEVYKSTDGGKAFTSAVVAQEVGGHDLGVPWLAADPSDATHQTLYVAYTDAFPGDPACSGATSTTARVSKSTDGGNSWSAGVDGTGVGAAFCPPVIVSNATITVGTTGVVHLAYYRYDDTGGVGIVAIGRSTDGGATFGEGPGIAALPVGDPAVGPALASAGTLAQKALQGHVFPMAMRPMIAVDRSGKAGFNNNVYVVFDAGGAVASIDVGFAPYLIPASTYTFGDVFLWKSTDGGGTYAVSAVKVNGNVEPTATGAFAGRATDQFSPGVAVDKNGAVGVCWYDRRNDPANFLYDRYCAKSLNQNLATPTFVAIKKTTKAAPLWPKIDLFADWVLGDFDTVASDFTKLLTGFRSAYTDTSAGNSDVKMSIF